MLFSRRWRTCLSIVRQQFSSNSSKPPSGDLYNDIQQRVKSYKRQLKKHVSASLKHRQLASQIGNLTEAMMTLEQRVQAEAASEPVPTRISLEVLSSGTGNMEPSILLRTQTRQYLVNCPESTSRMLPSLSARANAINDVLITSCGIDRIGGISGFMLSQSRGVAPTRIHGPPFIRNYLEFMRPFADAEFGEVKYPGTVVEQPYDRGTYRDVAFTINYIPMYDLAATSDGSAVRADNLSIAYLIETNPPVRRIDMLKVMAQKVPKGPLIGQLKAGKPVTLADGRVVQPEDVYADENDEIDGIRDSSVLIVDCTSVQQLSSLTIASVLQPFLKQEKPLNFVVHFSKPQIVASPEYRQLLKTFDSVKATQLIVNGTGAPDPHIESIFRLQAAHSTIDPSIFPPLWPACEEKIDESSPATLTPEGHVLARPIQRFVLRGPKIIHEEGCAVDLRPAFNPLLDKAIKDDVRKIFTTSCADLLPTSREPEPYPRIAFLGTSSAVPSKYRNVTCVFIETKNSAYVFDSGEGSFGQMKQLFGERIDEVLGKLRIAFMTHTHQDHTNGLITLLQKHFVLTGKKLVVVCNRNILKHMHTFSQRFYSIYDFADFVVPNVYVDRRPAPAEIDRLLIHQHLEAAMPDISARAVKVNHTSDAVGYVIETKAVDGMKKRKIVISGDTTPCDLLVQEGQGADVLVHEATFEDGFEDDAQHKKHSTMSQAVEIGRRMGAKHTILTHFSARYPKVPALPLKLDELNIGIAMDNMVVPMDALDRIPRLNAAYRQLYNDELFEIEQRALQRGLRIEPPPAKKAARQGAAATATEAPRHRYSKQGSQSPPRRRSPNRLAANGSGDQR